MATAMQPRQAPVEPPLPFEVHRPGAVSQRLRHDAENLAEFVWDHSAQSLAEEALERGSVLSVPVPPECVAQALAIICSHLTCNVYARYDERRHVLILWDQDAVAKGAD